MLKDGRIAKVERRAYTNFFGSLTIALLVLFTGVFPGFALHNAGLVRESVLARGRSLFNQSVLTRRWAAEYGGVYVKKGEGAESNPWLDHPDLEAADTFETRALLAFDFGATELWVAALDRADTNGGIDARLHQADHALYRAKSAGKNQYLAYKPPDGIF